MRGRSWRVIVLEDDDGLRDDILLPGLANYGFDAAGFANIAALQAGLQAGAPDAIVLDVGLPDGSGFNVARDVRAACPDVGIVMLTSRDKTPDRIFGLNQGADAYLAKPVEIDLLAATLHSLLRRLHPGTTPTTAVDKRWRMDGDDWCLLTPDGVAIPLTRTERRLIARLLETPAKLVRREQLIAAVASNVFEFDPHRLDALIHRIRRKTTQNGAVLPLSLVHGEGYVFNDVP